MILNAILDTESWAGLIVTTFRTGAVALFVYISAIVLYRLTLHPLAGYPGPLLARITDLDNFYHAFMWDRHVNFAKCHERYGPVYRYGPSRLSFNTNTALRDIYSAKSNVQKAEYYTAFNIGPASAFSTIDKSSHARKRRVLTHAFNQRALEAMEEYFLEGIRKWTALLSIKSISEGKVDMSSYCTFLSFDIMFDLAFGRSSDMLSTLDHSIPDGMAVAGTLSNLLGTSSMMRWLSTVGFDRVLFPKLRAGRLAFESYAEDQAKQRVSSGSGRKDFYHYLIEAKDPDTGKGFEMTELWAESALLIIAGSDTTATVLAGAMFYLTQPQSAAALAKAQSEIRSAFESVEDIASGPDLYSCTYLRACLDETMRMAPPVPGGLPREVCQGGATIDGHHIPAGTDVSVGTFSIHHKSEYYPEPKIFKPERWLASNDGKSGFSKEQVEKAQSAFCPFSIGPRGCIGKNMAYMEMSLALARALWLFDFERVGTLGNAPDGTWRLKDRFNADKTGPTVRFVER